MIYFAKVANIVARLINENLALHHFPLGGMRLNADDAVPQGLSAWARASGVDGIIRLFGVLCRWQLGKGMGSDYILAFRYHRTMEIIMLQVAPA